MRQSHDTQREQELKKAAALFDRAFQLDGQDCKLPDPKHVFTAQPWVEEDLQATRLKLEAVKNQLDELDNREWDRMVTQLDRSAEVKQQLRRRYQVELGTVAWAKMFELLGTQDLLPQELPAQIQQQQQQQQQVHSYQRPHPYVLTMHLCEAPGAFVCATNHFVKTQRAQWAWDWLASSLNPYYEANDQFEMNDDDSFIAATLDHWRWGADNSGDIREPRNVRALWAAAAERAAAHGCQGAVLVTADGGVDCSMDPNRQEEMSSPLHLAELVAGLGCLVPGGHLVYKAFTQFQHAAICLLYVMTCVFDTVRIVKPGTSKSANSEVYIVGQGFKGAPPELLEALLAHMSKDSDPFASHAMFAKEQLPASFLHSVKAAACYFADFTAATITECLTRVTNLHETEKVALKEAKAWFADEWMSRMRMQRLPRHLLLVQDTLLDGSNNNNSNVVQRRRDLEGRLQDRREQYKHRRAERCWGAAVGSMDGSASLGTPVHGQLHQQLQEQQQGTQASVVAPQLSNGSQQLGPGHQATTLPVAAATGAAGHSYEAGGHAILQDVPGTTSSFLAGSWSRKRGPSSQGGLAEMGGSIGSSVAGIASLWGGMDSDAPLVSDWGPIPDSTSLHNHATPLTEAETKEWSITLQPRPSGIVHSKCVPDDLVLVGLKSVRREVQRLSVQLDGKVCHHTGPCVAPRTHIPESSSSTHNHAASSSTGHAHRAGGTFVVHNRTYWKLAALDAAVGFLAICRGLAGGRDHRAGGAQHISGLSGALKHSGPSPHLSKQGRTGSSSMQGLVTPNSTQHAQQHERQHDRQRISLAKTTGYVGGGMFSSLSNLSTSPSSSSESLALAEDENDDILEPLPSHPAQLQSSHMDDAHFRLPAGSIASSVQPVSPGAGVPSAVQVPMLPLSPAMAQVSGTPLSPTSTIAASVSTPRHSTPASKPLPTSPSAAADASKQEASSGSHAWLTALDLCLAPRAAKMLGSDAETVDQCQAVEARQRGVTAFLQEKDPDQWQVLHASALTAAGSSQTQGCALGGMSSAADEHSMQQQQGACRYMQRLTPESSKACAAAAGRPALVVGDLSSMKKRFWSNRYFGPLGVLELEYESCYRRQLIWEAATALQCVAEGGVVVLRLGDCFTIFSMCLVYIMYRSFNQICLLKPFASCACSQERFLVCIGRQEDGGAAATHLLNVLAKMVEVEMEAASTSASNLPSPVQRHGVLTDITQHGQLQQQQQQHMVDHPEAALPLQQPSDISKSSGMQLQAGSTPAGAEKPQEQAVHTAAQEAPNTPASDGAAASTVPLLPRGSSHGALQQLITEPMIVAELLPAKVIFRDQRFYEYLASRTLHLARRETQFWHAAVTAINQASGAGVDARKMLVKRASGMGEEAEEQLLGVMDPEPGLEPSMPLTASTTSCCKAAEGTGAPKPDYEKVAEMTQLALQALRSSAAGPRSNVAGGGVKQNASGRPPPASMRPLSSSQRSLNTYLPGSSPNYTPPHRSGAAALYGTSPPFGTLPRAGSPVLGSSLPPPHSRTHCGPSLLGSSPPYASFGGQYRGGAGAYGSSPPVHKAFSGSAGASPSNYSHHYHQHGGRRGRHGGRPGSGEERDWLAPKLSGGQSQSQSQSSWRQSTGQATGAAAAVGGGMSAAGRASAAGCASAAGTPGGSDDDSSWTVYHSKHHHQHQGGGNRHRRSSSKDGGGPGGQGRTHPHAAAMDAHKGHHVVQDGHGRSQRLI